MPKYIFFRAIDVLDCQLERIEVELAHPELRTSSEVRPLARWHGKIAELLEYTIPIQTSECLRKPDGQTMNYIDAVRLLETIFGISIPDAYDRKTKILNRRKIATFINKMLAVFVNEAKKSHAKPPLK